MFRTRRTAGLQARLDRAARDVPTAHAGPCNTRTGSCSPRSAPRSTSSTRSATPRLCGELSRLAAALVTGQPAVQADLDPVFSADLHRGEAIAIPLTLLVLLALLGLSLAVVVPFIVAACTISITLGVVFLIAHELSMVAYVRNLVELIGLGLAVDYSLLIVRALPRGARRRGHRRRCGRVDRWRRRGARSRSRAAPSPSASACAAVPVPFVRSLGIGGLLIPLVSVAAALTLQPALLALFGMRLAGPRDASARLGRIARTIMRRPGSFSCWHGRAGRTRASGHRPAPDSRSLTGIPASSESVRGYDALAKALGGGWSRPRTSWSRAAPLPPRERPGGSRDELFHERERSSSQAAGARRTSMRAAATAG